MKKGIFNSAVLIMFATLLNRLTSLLRENVLAYTYGASAHTDAFLAAFLIPDTLVLLLSSGSLSAALVVLLNEKGDKDKPQFEKVINVSFTAIILLSLVITILGLDVSPWLVRVTGLGFSPETFDIAVELNRMMFPVVMVLSITGVFIGIQYYRKVFLPPTLAPIATNLAMVGCILFLHKAIGIKAAALGVLIGAILQVAIYFTTTGKLLENYRFKPSLELEILKPLSLLTVSMSVTLAAQQSGLIINRIFASTLSEGSMAVLNYASQIYYLPIGLFGLAVSTAIYPSLCSQAAARSKEFINTLSYGVKLAVFAIAPVTIGLLLTNRLLISIFFERGAFDTTATDRTSHVFRFLVFGIGLQVLIMVFTKAFHAAKDVNWSLGANVVGIILNIVLNFYLIRYELVGIALSTVISSFISMVLLIIFSVYRLGFRISTDLMGNLAKIIFCSSIMGLVIWLPTRYLNFDSTLNELLFKVSVGIIVYFGLSALLRVSVFENR